MAMLSIDERQHRLRHVTNPGETLASILVKGEPLWPRVGEAMALFMVCGKVCSNPLHRLRVEHWPCTSFIVDSPKKTCIGSNPVGQRCTDGSCFLGQRVLPGGALLVLPLLLLLSVASPAARVEWGVHRTPRLMALGVAVLCLGATGAVPVEEPVSPEAWGQPLFTENPNAPVYPASQQYTWFTTDVVILQSISMRLPHQPGVVGAEWTAMTMASVLNMETSRMHQAIELLDEEVPFVRLNSDEVLLCTLYGCSPTQEVDIRWWHQKTKVGDVVVANWGGKLDILELSKIRCQINGLWC